MVTAEVQEVIPMEDLEATQMEDKEDTSIKTHLIV